ncbi:hypothetical protein [Priestia taiwanensis]|uniref:Uncharacterized protein n=1 Tax=Priestia taiwanensis TaxID=1347902 RepID=A0A917AIJ9_9BACI|nr:hypothetical protein [Priestia taiwanensis]MBM7361631.1 hypothetical protein [Priestia taiwanensis]GGE55681.1 hypothetical protein GCM10007140_02550 [Priestia taiwanensis]
MFFSRKKKKYVMGGELKEERCKVEERGTEKHDVERYFRPSCLPVLNTRISRDFFDPYYDKKYDEIVLPSRVVKSPEDTILYYFSVLWEAAYFAYLDGRPCGSVGAGTIPYPVAYNFLSKAYQKRISYKTFLTSFTDIAHVNLIKINHVQVDIEHPHVLRYFIEIETIQSTSKHSSSFIYYYGYVYIKKDSNGYYINDMEFYEEDFLCAAYHLWQHNAEAVVAAKYGNWCNLVKKILPTKQDGYVKTIGALGDDGEAYQFVFFQLTNDTDVLVGQYKKGASGKWEDLHLVPEDCTKQKG